MTYATRKEQLLDFRRELIEKLGGEKSLPKGARRAIDAMLKDAAFVGACEERDHALRFVDRKTADAIVKVSVLEVLGYSATKEKA